MAHLSQPVIELVSECAKPECSKHTAPAAGCAGWLAGGAAGGNAWLTWVRR